MARKLIALLVTLAASLAVFPALAQQANGIALTAHQLNYMMPIAYSSDASDFSNATPTVVEDVDQLEFHFQLSIKLPVQRDFLVHDSTLWFGYTVRSFWQAYNTEDSRPFRETNHEPEIFWRVPSTIELGGWRNMDNTLILNHQSNGQAGQLSRTWNRAMLASRWRYGPFVTRIKPWLILPHQPSADAIYPEDNPDIDQYLGHFEWLTTYHSPTRHEFSIMLRNNLDWGDNRGAVELGWSFPLHKQFRGYISYFNGYGESLVDYNHSQERLSIGIQVSDWFSP